MITALLDIDYFDRELIVHTIFKLSFITLDWADFMHTVGEESHICICW